VKKSLFITFEGPEGSGKSTQAKILVEALRSQGVPVVHTREPGGTPIAEAVRRVLLHPNGRVAPMTELFLYEAARAQHLADIVRPALEQGRVVVCERYTDATEAYQGHGRGLNVKDIALLNRVATDGLKPDITFLLDVPPAQGLRHARTLSKRLSKTGKVAKGGDRMERQPLAFHRRVRAGYLQLARRDSRRIQVIPWGQSVEKVHAVVLGATLKHLPTRSRQKSPVQVRT